MASDHEHIEPETDPPIDPRLRTLYDQLRRPELWTLSQPSRPLHTLLDGGEPVHGKLRRRNYRGDVETLDFTIQLVTDANVPTLRLQVAEWPQKYAAIALVLADFEYWKFPVSSAGQMLTPADKPRVADLETRSRVGAGLAASSTSDKPALPTLDLEDVGDLWGTYRQDDAVLDVFARVPEDREAELAVAELRHVDEDGRLVCQQRGVHLKQQEVGHSHSEVRFYQPKKPGSTEVRVLVRSCTDDDLPLFNPPAVHALLARSASVSVLAQPGANGIDLRLRWEDQHQFAANPQTCWALQVAKEGTA